jgi:hypothetical protein
MLGEGERALYLPVERRPSHSRHRVHPSGQDRAGKLPESRPLPPGRLRRRLCDLAHSALSVVGCRDYGRLDVLLAEDRLWALGASAQPCLPDPLFSACAAGAGLTTEGCLGAMVLSALGRQPQRKARPASLPSSLIMALPPGLVAFFGAELCEGVGVA